MMVGFWGLGEFYPQHIYIHIYIYVCVCVSQKKMPTMAIGREEKELLGDVAFSFFSI